MRAVELGMPLQQALNAMAERIDTDEVSLMVTAITVQYEMGGNLAQTLDTIGETVRDRIEMLREIRVLTAHQRFTAWVLALLPVALAVVFFLRDPEYMGRLFEPGMMRLVLIATVIMQLLGVVIIRRIVDVEV